MCSPTRKLISFVYLIVTVKLGNCEQTYPGQDQDGGEVEEGSNEGQTVHGQSEVERLLDVLEEVGVLERRPGLVDDPKHGLRNKLHRFAGDLELDIMYLKIFTDLLTFSELNK